MKINFKLFEIRYYLIRIMILNHRLNHMTITLTTHNYIVYTSSLFQIRYIIDKLIKMNWKIIESKYYTFFQLLSKITYIKYLLYLF